MKRLYQLLAFVIIVFCSSTAMGRTREVTIPEEDRFTPYVLVIRVGDVVRFTNRDGDDHRIVSIDAFSTVAKGVDLLLPGTENNGGYASALVIRFLQPGIFPYYCRLHAFLDSSNQPVAKAGESIESPDGNFGTPMSGFIVVLPSRTAAEQPRRSQSPGYRIR